MFDMFKTTKITRTVNGREVKVDDNPELWKKFDVTMEKFNDTMSSFDETMEKLGKTSSTSEEVELYGTSKEDAVNKANTYSVDGFKMTSLVEDQNLKVWKVTMKKEL